MARRPDRNALRPFSQAGQRYRIATGERDPGPASSAAARIYAEVVSGRWRPGRQQIAARAGTPFEEVAAAWLADVEPPIDAKTFRLYRDTYVAAHFAPFFETIDRLTTVGAQDYIVARLRKVQRETLKKELPVLRRLAKWAFQRGLLAARPEIETPDRRVLGTAVADSRKRTFLIFTAEEIVAIIGHLPERASGPRAPIPFPVRARFMVAWETALRPATLAALRAPESYRRGATELAIREEDDKNRLGRCLPLSEAARDALDNACPEVGLIFGAHDYRRLLREAARAAGIDAYRAERISDYDFRHSRLTHFGRVTDNLAGVMYLAGHTQPATTARYMRPLKDAAEEVLRAVAAAGKPEFRSHSGHTNTRDTHTAKRDARSESTASKRDDSGFPVVRGGGLEPPLLSKPDPKTDEQHQSPTDTRVVAGTYSHTETGSDMLRHARVGGLVGGVWPRGDSVECDRRPLLLLAGPAP